MKMIDKLSECEDKLLDPRTLSFRLKHPMRRKINDLLSRCEQDQDDSGHHHHRSHDGDGDSRSDKSASKLGVTLQEILDRDEDQKQLLSYDDLSEVHRILQHMDPTYRLFFHELLDECRAFVTDQRSNKELADRLKKLQFDLGNKSYKEMTRTIIEPSRTSAAGAAIDIASEGTVASDKAGLTSHDPSSHSCSEFPPLPSHPFPVPSVRQLRPVMITLTNSVMVIAATFLFVFKAVEYSMAEPDVTIQVMASLIAATVVAVAELYFFAKII